MPQIPCKSKAEHKFRKDYFGDLYCVRCGIYKIPHGMGPAPTLTLFMRDDDVHSPEHYKTGGIETIEILEAKLTGEEFRGYCTGNVIKYLTRARHKGNDRKDLEKAKWYLDRLLTYVQHHD